MDLPFALSEQRQRQRRAFLDRLRLQTEECSRGEGVGGCGGVETTSSGLQPRRSDRNVRDLVVRVEPEPELEPVRDLDSDERVSEPARRHSAAASVLLALAGESLIDLGPLSIHVSAGAAM
eukprot:COSAG02_NODE_39481_length_416_cov_1.441640_1_plen_120_part_01